MSNLLPFQIFYKIVVFKFFSNFTGKYTWRSSLQFYWKKKSSTGAFSLILRNFFCSTNKYFPNKIESPLKKRKKIETVGQENNNTCRKETETLLTWSLHTLFTIQKFLYFSFLCFPWHIESTCFLETLQSHLRVIYYRKLFLIFQGSN